MNRFSVPSKYKKVTQLFSLIFVLLAGVFATWYLNNNSLNTGSKATGGTTLTVTAPQGQATPKPGETFTVQLYLIPNGKKVTAVEMYVTADPGITINSITQSGTLLPVVLIPGKVDAGGQSASIILGCNVTTPVETSGAIATLTATASSTATGIKKISIGGSTRIAAVGFPTSVLESTVPYTVDFTPTTIPATTLPPTSTATPPVTTTVPPVTTTVPPTTIPPTTLPPTTIPPTTLPPTTIPPTTLPPTTIPPVTTTEPPITAPPTTVPPTTMPPTSLPPTTVPPTTTPPYPIGDINHDYKVNMYDYNTLLTDYGKTGTPGFIPADLNKDGKVNLYDYNLLLGYIAAATYPT